MCAEEGQSGGGMPGAGVDVGCRVFLKEPARRYKWRWEEGWAWIITSKRPSSNSSNLLGGHLCHVAVQLDKQNKGQPGLED